MPSRLTMRHPHLLGLRSQTDWRWNWHGVSGRLPQAYALNLLWHGEPRDLAFFHSSLTFAKQSFKLYGVISKSEDKSTLTRPESLPLHGLSSKSPTKNDTPHSPMVGKNLRLVSRGKG
jgi:hypothetical protein